VDPVRAVVMSVQGIDTIIFEHLHYLLKEQGRSDSFERRNNERKPFRTIQWVAECGEDPSRLSSKDFEKRECFDISSGGIAYFNSVYPSATHVTVAIGQVPLKFVLATIRHAKQVDDGRWLVGCQFVRKLS
jgi:hypothetical protein